MLLPTKRGYNAATFGNVNTAVRLWGCLPFKHLVALDPSCPSSPPIWLCTAQWAPRAPLVAPLPLPPAYPASLASFPTAAAYRGASTTCSKSSRGMRFPGYRPETAAFETGPRAAVLRSRFRTLTSRHSSRGAAGP